MYVPFLPFQVPSKDDWLLFTHFMRVSRRSYPAARVDICRVVSFGKEVAMSYLEKHGMSYPADLFDPRIVYATEHQRMGGLMRREYGVEVKKCLALTMCEAKSGHNFIDMHCLRGIFMGGSFNAGNTTGGRRPRSIASLRVRDVQCELQSVVVNGTQWRVPSFKLTFRDEKYMCERGPRRSLENFAHIGNYTELMCMSYSYYLYAQFVARGIFLDDNPISSCEVGGRVEFKRSALDFFVFCEDDGDVWYDGIPLAAAKLSAWTKTITMRMGGLTGLPARGYRAHRCVSLYITIMAFYVEHLSLLCPGFLHYCIYLFN